MQRFTTSSKLHCRFCGLPWFYYLNLKTAGGLIRRAHTATQHTTGPLSASQKKIRVENILCVLNQTKSNIYKKQKNLVR